MKKKVGIVIIGLIVIVLFKYFNDRDYTVKSVDYLGDNLRISIDGEVSSTLPTSGTYYLADYKCKSNKTKLEWNSTSYELSVSNGNKRAGVSCNLDFQSSPLLSYMEEGSYVSYVGSNGCDSAHCDGTNANYESDSKMGYCYDSSYQFIVNGWRIGYVDKGNVYLVSAGASECMCTDSSGTMASSGCSNGIASYDNLYLHFNNMNSVALKYCNLNYANGGVCDDTTTWAMDAGDFEMITGKPLSQSSCSALSSDKTCGYNNDLIDNGSHYWYATEYNSTGTTVFYWDFYYNHSINNGSTVTSYGVRPVIKLDSSVVVTGGDGTYTSPYTIGNNSFSVSQVSAVDDVSSVNLNLVALDNVQEMCVNVNSSSCSNYVEFPTDGIYTLDITDYVSESEIIIYVYYKDVNGNIVASINRSVVFS